MITITIATSRTKTQSYRIPPLSAREHSRPWRAACDRPEVVVGRAGPSWRNPRGRSVDLDQGVSPLCPFSVRLPVRGPSGGRVMGRSPSESLARHPKACPVCRIAMVAERSAPDLAEPDAFRCLNCGSVVVGAREGDALDGTAANRASGRVPIRPEAVSPMDQFVIRQNIAIYNRQLGRETDPARRELLRRLLDGERAKRGLSGSGGPVSD
jgi:hypothetical protein